MEQTMETQQLLEKIELSNHKQERYARLQCIFTAAAAVACLGILIAVLVLMPQVAGVLNRIETVMANLEQATQQLAQADIAGVMADLKDVTQQLAQADLTGLVGDLDSLAATCQTALEGVLAKLEVLDMKALNQAITDLASVAKSMKDFFHIFSR